VNVAFDFRDGASGWEPVFVDYPVVPDAEFALTAELRPLPPRLNDNGTGFLLSGINRSDDLFMGIYRRLGPEDGIVPGVEYRLSYSITFASNAPDDCLGVGGAPGESVWLKAGGSGSRPEAIEAADGHYRLSLDKANQSQSGAEASVVDIIANGIPCEEAFANLLPYVSLDRQHTHPQNIAASPDGEIWLLVGTDSGFESLTAMFYQQITVELAPQ